MHRRASDDRRLIEFVLLDSTCLEEVLREYVLGCFMDLHHVFLELRTTLDTATIAKQQRVQETANTYRLRLPR